MLLLNDAHVARTSLLLSFFLSFSHRVNFSVCVLLLSSTVSFLRLRLTVFVCASFFAFNFFVFCWFSGEDFHFNFFFRLLLGRGGSLCSGTNTRTCTHTDEKRRRCCCLVSKNYSTFYYLLLDIGYCCCFDHKHTLL